MDWQPITDDQRDGKIYWVANPYPIGVVIYEHKARFARGKWRTMISRKWQPFSPEPTHYRKVDGQKSIQELIGPMFKPGVVGIISNEWVA